jgi:amidase
MLIYVRSGPLHGLPLLLKDTIDTEHLSTTAGSYALADSSTPDPEVVKKLRTAGSVILGKANLSQWGYWRSRNLPKGWTAIGTSFTSFLSSLIR